MPSFRSVARAMVKTHPESLRWPYVPGSIVLGLFSLAVGEVGFGAAPWIVLFVLCLVQMRWPTFLGWSVQTVLFAAYAIAIADHHVRHPTYASTSDYVVFQCLGVIPAILLVVGGPKPRMRYEGAALLTSLALALFVIVPFIFGSG